MTDTPIPATEPYDVIVCACAQVAVEANGDIVAIWQPGGVPPRVLNVETIEHGWLALARLATQADLVGIARQCLAQTDAPPLAVEYVTLPARPEMDEVPAPYANRPVPWDDPALWGDDTTAVTDWEDQETRRNFRNADHALRQLIAWAADELAAVHKGDVRPSIGSLVGQRVAEYHEANAALRSLRDARHHRRKLAAQARRPCQHP